MFLKNVEIRLYDNGPKDFLYVLAGSGHFQIRNCLSNDVKLRGWLDELNKLEVKKAKLYREGKSFEEVTIKKESLAKKIRNYLASIQADNYFFVENGTIQFDKSKIVSGIIACFSGYDDCQASGLSSEIFVKGQSITAVKSIFNSNDEQHISEAILAFKSEKPSYVFVKYYEDGKYQFQEIYEVSPKVGIKPVKSADEEDAVNIFELLK